MSNITIKDVPLKRLDELAEIMAMSREDMLNILIDDAWCETMAHEDETDHSNCRHEFLVLDHEKGKYFCSNCGVYIPLDLDDVPY
jgi:hypothetical protein